MLHGVTGALWVIFFPFVYDLLQHRGHFRHVPHISRRPGAYLQLFSKEKILHAVEWKVCDGIYIYLGLKIVVFEVSIFRFSLLFLISAFLALNA